MPETTKLIWRGAAACRSLCVRTPSGPRFFTPGDEVPADVTMPSTSIEILIAQGKIERVAVPEPPHSSATRSVVSSKPAPVPHQVAAPVASSPVSHPRSITVDVGCMEATVDAGLDDVLGTDDDLVTIEPIREPGPQAVPDGRPDTAPVRKRSPSKKRGTAKTAAKKKGSKK